MNSADWTAVAAVATALLAVATFVMALKTGTMAKATTQVARETKGVGEATLKEAKAVEKQVEQIEKQLLQVERQVDVSASTLRVSVQPWLVWEPPKETHGLSPMNPLAFYVAEHADDGTVIGALSVRNVGNGIALLDMERSFLYPRNERRYEDVHPSVATPVLAPGDTGIVEFADPGAQSVRSGETNAPRSHRWRSQPPHHRTSLLGRARRRKSIRQVSWLPKKSPGLVVRF